MDVIDDKVMNVMSLVNLLECNDRRFLKESGKEKKKGKCLPRRYHRRHWSGTHPRTILLAGFCYIETILSMVRGSFQQNGPCPCIWPPDECQADQSQYSEPRPKCKRSAGPQTSQTIAERGCKHISDAAD